MKTLTEWFDWIVLLTLFLIPLACTKPGAANLPAETMEGRFSLNLRIQADRDREAAEELTQIQREIAKEQEAEE